MTGDAWIDTVRFARDFGTVDHLLPTGVRSLRDLPATIFSAIRDGLLYLSFEELPAEDQPPKRLWRNADGLRSWFEDVRRHRGHDRDDGEIEDPVDNEAAKGLIVG